MNVISFPLTLLFFASGSFWPPQESTSTPAHPFLLAVRQVPRLSYAVVQEWAVYSGMAAVSWELPERALYR
jgi:hypothetical protein